MGGPSGHNVPPTSRSTDSIFDGCSSPGTTHSPEPLLMHIVTRHPSAASFSNPDEGDTLEHRVAPPVAALG